MPEKMSHPYFLKQGMYQSTFLTKYTVCMIFSFLLFFFFLFPTLVVCWLTLFHICFTELKIYHLWFFHHTVRQRHCCSLQYAGRVSYMNLVYSPAFHEFSVAQVDRAPAWCFGSHRFESGRTQSFSLSHPRGMLINSFSHFFHRA